MPSLKINSDNWDTIKSLEAQGLHFPTSSDIDTPALPSDLSDLSDEQLMELFVHFTSYWNFLSAQLAVAIIDERAAERELNWEENVALLKANGAKGSKDTVTLLKVQVAMEPEVMRQTHAHEGKYAYRKLVEVMANNAERDTNLISRELTRRTSGGAARSRGNWATP